MKKVLISILVILALLTGAGLVLLHTLGLSATDLKANMDVGTGMGAKLACSARHLTGLGFAQIREDLASYTAATDTLTLDYDDGAAAVTASLFGLATTTARFREGLGCTLEIGDTTVLDTLQVADLPSVRGEWPAGNEVRTHDSAVQDRLDAMLAADNAAGLQTRALLVAHRGRVVGESYAPGFDHESMLLGWSMGKSLTAILLGHLEYLDKLSVDENNLFMQWRDDERAQLTVEHLLQMSSGLEFSEIYAPGSDATAMLFTAHSASDVALASPLAFAPGTHFYYSSGTTNMLTRLLAERLGGPQAAVSYLRDEILAPLSMRHTVMEPDASGMFVGSSYVYASARDWARLGQLMLNEGQLNGVRLLSEDWVARAQSPNTSDNDPRYGYQFWLNGGGDVLRWSTLPEDAYAMNGNRAQTVMVVPSAEAVLVRLGWTSGRYPMAENFTALLEVL